MGSEMCIRDSFEFVFALLLHESADEVRRVMIRRLLVSQKNHHAFAGSEAVLEGLYVPDEILEADPQFGEVGFFGSRCQRPHKGQKTALTSHDLDDESSAGGAGRVSDFVEGIHDVVEGGVGADAEFRSRQIVVDGCRNQDHGNPERRESLSLGNEPFDLLVGAPTADGDESFDSVLLSRVELICARSSSVRSIRAVPISDPG